MNLMQVNYYVKKFNIKKDEKKLISSYKFKTPPQSQLL